MKRVFFIALFALIILLNVCTVSAESQMEVRFLNVGHADAAIITLDGHAMIIDGGDKSDSSLIYTVIKNEGITHLDYVICSHVHDDHIGGLPGAFIQPTIGLVLCPTANYDSDSFADFAKYANLKSNGITIPSIGDTLPFGEADITIISLNAGNAINDSSIILKIQYGNIIFMFTGDAEAEAEAAAIASGYDLKSTVLKVGHHGSATSTTESFIKAVNPVYAVISTGDDISYGCPDESVLRRLYNAGTVVYCTDNNGDIIFYTDGQSITVATERTTKAESTSEETEADYIINTNTKKFHRPDCSSVKKIKAENKSNFNGTKEELISYGYSPCGNCKP